MPISWNPDTGRYENTNPSGYSPWTQGPVPDRPSTPKPPADTAPQAPASDPNFPNKDNPGAEFVAPRRRMHLGEIYGLYGQDLPGESAYYDAIIGRSTRGLNAQLANAQHRGLNALEQRGFGRSSEAGNLARGIAALQAAGVQDIRSNVEGLRFQAHQGRINDALSYERNKGLNIVQGAIQAAAQPSFLESAFNTAIGAGGYILGGGLSSPQAQQGGSPYYNAIQSAPSGPMYGPQGQRRQGTYEPVPWQV